MLKRILIIVFLDIIILAVFVWYIDATPALSIAEVVILPGILIINLIVAGVFSFSKTNKYGGVLFLINALIAPFIFHLLFNLWFVYYDSTHFVNYYFNIESEKYQLTLLKKEKSFYLSDVTNQKRGSTNGLIMGDYILKKDTVLLLDTAKQMKIINSKLIGYPSLKDTMQLKVNSN